MMRIFYIITIKKMIEMEKTINDFLNHERTKNALIFEINKTDILKHYSKRT
jgi:hypothetical protein